MTLRVGSPRLALALLLIFVAGAFPGCRRGLMAPAVEEPARFRIAMIPDTQNYVDYTHQRDQGFALDASRQFIQQMAWA